MISLENRAFCFKRYYCIAYSLDPDTLYPVTVCLIISSNSGNKRNRYKPVEQRQQCRQITRVWGQPFAVPAPHSRRGQTKHLPAKPAVSGQHGRLQHRKHDRFFVAARVHTPRLFSAFGTLRGRLEIFVFGGASLRCLRFCLRRLPCLRCLRCLRCLLCLARQRPETVVRTVGDSRRNSVDAWDFDVARHLRSCWRLCRLSGRRRA